MATVRGGCRGGLLIVDMQVGVLADAWQASRTADAAAQAVQGARDHGVPVIWVQHHSAELAQGSAAWQWTPLLQPAEGEALIHKAFNSAFEHTSLESTLARLGISHIVLAGASSNWCIRATAYAALERGYDLTLLADAHTTESLDLGDGVVVQAEGIVHDLNATFAWLRYPGRRTAALAVRELDFDVLREALPAPPSAPKATLPVRVLGVGDVEGLREMLGVFARAFEGQANYSANQPDDAYLQQRLQSESFFAVAAFDGCRVVGGLAGYALPKFEPARTEFFIDDLAVDAAYRRRGVATSMIRAVQRLAAERGFMGIFVQANHGDEPAIALYDKLGLRKEVLHFDILPSPDPLA